jgi:hypothetical protein
VKSSECSRPPTPPPPSSSPPGHASPPPRLVVVAPFLDHPRCRGRRYHAVLHGRYHRCPLLERESRRPERRRVRRIFRLHQRLPLRFLQGGGDGRRRRNGGGDHRFHVHVPHLLPAEAFRVAAGRRQLGLLLFHVHRYVGPGVFWVSCVRVGGRLPTLPFLLSSPGFFQRIHSGTKTATNSSSASRGQQQGVRPRTL